MYTAVCQVVYVNNVYAELRCTVPQSSSAFFCCDDCGFRDISAEAVAQNGQFVQCLRSHGSRLAAYENRNNPSCTHDIQFVGYGIASARAFPIHNRARDHVIKQTGIQTCLVNIKFQYTAHIPKPRTNLRIAEPEADGFIFLDFQVRQKTDLFQISQCLFRRVDEGRPLTFYRIPSAHFQGEIPFRRTRRDTLKIGYDFAPLLSVFQIHVKEGFDIFHIMDKNAVVHPARAHGAAGHQKTVLNTVGYAAANVHGKAGVPDVIETVLSAAVGENGQVVFSAEQTRCEQDRVGSAGDVQ